MGEISSSLEDYIEAVYSIYIKDNKVKAVDDYTVSQYIHGGITSIKQYPYKMGVACANTVISMIEGNRVPDWIPMEYKLMKRASTKK